MDSFFEKFEITVYPNSTHFEPCLMWFDGQFPLIIFVAAIYIVVVQAGRVYMKVKPAFSLKWPLTVWSLSLAVFSILGAYRLVTMFLFLWDQNGIYRAIFDSHDHFYNGPTGFWSMLFVLSKLVEFGDTLFIILRKKPLLFLHWYHHASALIITWYIYPRRVSSAGFLAAMNYTVHAVMYIYYALQASKLVTIPKYISMCLTTLAMVQFSIAILIHCYAILQSFIGRDVPSVAVYPSVILVVVFTSYLISFVHFFRWRYLTPQAEDVAQPKKGNTPPQDITPNLQKVPGNMVVRQR